MPNWREVMSELTSLNSKSPFDTVRAKYLRLLSEKTGRNVIAYYSGFLNNPDSSMTSINDSDMNGFMTAINGMDRKKGLDLVLHTPGGGLAASEALVNYLREMFGRDIRAIIPQIAMSAGTMIACSCREIVMGKQSSIGPIDPQLYGLPAQGVLDEFERAVKSVEESPSSIQVWKMILCKYHPTMLGECGNAVEMARSVVSGWLQSNMFSEMDNPKKKAEAVVKKLGNHNRFKMHDRHIGISEAKKLGLRITDLEEDNEFQDLVLTVHHAYLHTMANTNAVKLIENQDRVGVVTRVAR